MYMVKDVLEVMINIAFECLGAKCVFLKGTFSAPFRAALWAAAIGFIYSDDYIIEDK